MTDAAKGTGLGSRQIQHSKTSALRRTDPGREMGGGVKRKPWVFYRWCGCVKKRTYDEKCKMQRTVYISYVFWTCFNQMLGKYAKHQHEPIKIRTKSRKKQPFNTKFYGQISVTRKNKQHLVGASNPIEKYWSNQTISPGFGVKIKKMFELPPPRTSVSALWGCWTLDSKDFFCSNLYKANQLFIRRYHRVMSHNKKRFSTGLGVINQIWFEFCFCKFCCK